MVTPDKGELVFTEGTCFNEPFGERREAFAASARPVLRAERAGADQCWPIRSTKRHSWRDKAKRGHFNGWATNPGAFGNCLGRRAVNETNRGILEVEHLQAPFQLGSPLHGADLVTCEMFRPAVRAAPALSK